MARRAEAFGGRTTYLSHPCAQWRVWTHAKVLDALFDSLAASAIRHVCWTCPVKPDTSMKDVLVEQEKKRSRRRFSDEFKRDAAALVIDTGRPVAQVARELGVYESSLGRWVAQELQPRRDR